MKNPWYRLRTQHRQIIIFLAIATLAIFLAIWIMSGAGTVSESRR